MESVDLTPFGFTPTESLAYSALLDSGPSSGYSLAQALGIARANTYQALRGLVAKRAAVLTGQDPQVFRAVQPSALLAEIVRDQQGKLDLLELQIASKQMAGAPATIEFTGERELYALALRSVTRSPGIVTCLAETRLLSVLMPIWRKRMADRAETKLWVVGDPPEGFPVALSGAVSERACIEHFGHPIVILVEQGCAAIGTSCDDALSGLWSSDPIIVGAARAAIAAILGST